MTPENQKLAANQESVFPLQFLLFREFGALVEIENKRTSARASSSACKSSASRALRRLCMRLLAAMKSSGRPTNMVNDLSGEMRCLLNR